MSENQQPYDVSPDQPTPPPATVSAGAARPAPAQPVQVTVNMPKQKRRWLLTLLLLCLVAIFYLIGVIAMLSGGSFRKSTLVSGDAVGSEIAVWEVSGAIKTETADEFEKFARSVIEKDSVKAVVVRIDSPGGAVSPSDRLNRALQKISEAGKPTVVSMGSVAASGGYYMASAADWIYAEPSTITGSIGVISMTPILKGTADLIGLDFLVIRSTRSQQNKASLNYFESPTERAVDAHRKLLDGIHEQFLQAVAAGRSDLGVEGISPLADGRVWLGGEAVELGLVDEIGYLSSAWEKAAELASLDNPEVVKYREVHGFGEQFLGARAKSQLNLDASVVDDFTSPRIMLLWRP